MQHELAAIWGLVDHARDIRNGLVWFAGIEKVIISSGPILLLAALLASRCIQHHASCFCRHGQTSRSACSMMQRVLSGFGCSVWRSGIGPLWNSVTTVKGERGMPLNVASCFS